MEKIKGVKIINLDKFTDERGYLIKIIKKEYVGNKFGEIYLTTTNPGSVKANHYHKKTNEWFCVLKGKCLLLMRDKKTNAEMELLLDGNDPKLISIPSFTEHAIKNVGDNEMILLAYADEPYDPLDTIPSDLSKLYK